MTRVLPSTLFGYCPVCSARGWFDTEQDLECGNCGVRFQLTGWKNE